MALEANKIIVRRWIEGSWTGSPSAFAEIVDSACVYQGVGGPREIGEGIDILRRAIAELKVTIEDQIAEKDKVVTQWTVPGIHSGELWGYGPSGRHVAYKGITINRLVDGKIVEDWFEGDLFGLIEQLRNAG